MSASADGRGAAIAAATEPRGLRIDPGVRAELDALYDQAQERVDALMREKGFGAPTFDTRVFEGAGHHERAWTERLHIPLAHLLGR